MSIMNLIQKKKAMQFKTEYEGKATRSGILGAGVTKYEKPSIGERIQSVKNSFMQKKAERKLTAPERKEKRLILLQRGQNAASFGKKVLNRIEKRSKENSGAYLTSNNQQPYFMQQSKRNTPYYLQTNSGNTNPYMFTKTEDKKEKTKNIIIKIPK